MINRSFLLIVIAMLAASCGSGEASPDDVSGSATTIASPTTTTAPTGTVAPTTTAANTTTSAPVTADDLAADGPWEVGVTTRSLPAGNPVEIFYPASGVAAGRHEEYRLRGFLPAAIIDLVPADLVDQFEVRAARDAPASADGPFPIVIFSHGFAGYRLQSTTLLRHLASWGMVVASPDHPGRDLAHIIENTGVESTLEPAADDLRSTLALLADVPGDPVLDGVADASRVALAGHSAGGFTVALAAGDEVIAGYVSYAAGGSDLPDVPSLFMAGANDVTVSPDITADSFRTAPTPSWMWTIGGAGHLAFTDVCLVGGGGSTPLDLADAAGLGDLIPDDLRRVASDGCQPPNRPVDEVWPAINQASTGFFRWVFGLDPQPVGLDATTVADVTIDAH